ncbi:MAG: 50S ribosomal protein L3 [Patescibacteria group bacterium]
MKILLGHKIGMTQVWDGSGKLVAATVIKAEPNAVIKDKAGSKIAVAVPGKTNKAQAAVAKQIGSQRGVWIKSISEVDEETKQLDVSQFSKGDVVAVSGVTKGKGFAGTIKRHNFHRGPVSHGSDNVRRPGSIGAQRPQRVPKGQKMAGHMGAVNFTARGNKVVDVIVEDGIVILSGAVPGPNRGRVIVKEI